jgi:hypothetical protein
MHLMFFSGKAFRSCLKDCELLVSVYQKTSEKCGCCGNDLFLVYQKLWKNVAAVEMIIVYSNLRIFRGAASTKVALSTLNWFWFGFRDGDRHCACQVSGSLLDSCCLSKVGESLPEVVISPCINSSG